MKTVIRSLVFLFAASWVGALPVQAAEGIRTQPNTIRLLAPGRPATIQIVNTSTEPTTFAVEVFRWSQPDGQGIVLSPVSEDEIAVYPKSLVVPPGQTRAVTVGRLTPFGPVEQTYRVRFKEIRPADVVQMQSSGVQTLVGITIPVFVGPSSDGKPVPTLSAHVSSNVVDLSFGDSGSEHYLPLTPRIVTYDASDRVIDDVSDKTIWYVLPGTTQKVDVVSKHACAVSKIIATFKVEGASLSTTTRLDPTCR